MGVYTAGSINLAGLTVDDTYVVVQKPSGTTVNGIPTAVGGLVGGASWGPVNSAVSLGSQSAVTSTFGPPSLGAKDLPTDANILLQLGLSNVWGVRVTDGTDAAATVDLTTPPVAASGTVTIGGTFHAGDVVTTTIGGVAVAYTTVTGDVNLAGVATSVAAAINANASAAAMVAAANFTGTVTIGGTFHAGDVVTVIINGTSVTHTVVAGDTNLAGVATGVAAAINANATLQALVLASASTDTVTITAITGNDTNISLSSSVSGVGATVTATASGATLAASAVVTLTAVTAGTAGNSISLVAAVTGSGATETATASGADLAGGAAGQTIATLTAKYSGTEGNNLSVVMVPGYNSTQAAPTWTMQVSRRGAAPQAEVFTNLAQSSLAASIVNALSNGQNASRGPSQLLTATAGTDPNAAPALTAFALTGGTNGDANITSAQQLGSNTAIPATGMYALAGNGVQGFGLCGNTDSTTWATADAFAQANGAVVFDALPAGTSTANAVAAVNTSGINSVGSRFVAGDWCQFFDTYNQQLRLWSPMAFALAAKIALSPEQSDENKPIGLIVATQRTLANSPYSMAELSQLDAARIGVITSPCPGGYFFGMRGSKNSSSDPTVNDLNYSTMTNFLAYSLNQAFGKYIGTIQSAQPGDPVRASAEKALNDFFGGLKRSRMIDDFSVDMSFGNSGVNTPTSVAQGYMNAVVKVKYLATVRFFVVSLIGGKTVQVK